MRTTGDTVENASDWWSRMLATLSDRLQQENVTIQEGSPDELFSLMYPEDDEEDSTSWDENKADDPGDTEMVLCVGAICSLVGKYALQTVVADHFCWFDELDEAQLHAIVCLLYFFVIANQEKPGMHVAEEPKIIRDCVPSLQQIEWCNSCGNDSLPICFLPLLHAMQFEEPPKYGTLSKKVPSEQYVVKIFVSHRWAQPDKPNLENDWKSVTEFLRSLVQNAIKVYTTLQTIDFPFIYLDLKMDKEIGFPSSSMPTSEIEGRAIGDVAGSLGWGVLSLVLEVTRSLFQYNLLEQMVLGRIWLWYDYACLPQKPDRTPTEYEWFRTTLTCLPEIQQSMNTIVVNSTASFFERAWCVAEWINSSFSCSLIDRDFGGKDFPRTFRGAFEIRTRKANMALEILLNPMVKPRLILRGLGVKFTDEEHDCFVGTICWILWNASFQSQNMILNELTTDSILLAQGEWSRVVRWLQMIIGAIEGSIDYSFDEWNSTRNHPEPFVEDSMIRTFHIRVNFLSSYPAIQDLRKALTENIGAIQQAAASCQNPRVQFRVLLVGQVAPTTTDYSAVAP